MTPPVPADSLVDSLLHRGLFPMVKVQRRFVVPRGEAARRALVEGGGYDPPFLPFLERVLGALAAPGFGAGSYYPGGWYRTLQAHGTDPAAARPTPEALRPFFREPLRVDARGRWWCGPRAIQGRVLRFFLRNLHYDEPLGLYCVRYPLEAAEEKQYVHAESPPLRVERLDRSSDPPRLCLNDGTEEPFRPETLWLDGRERLYCAVKPQRLTAAIDDPARWELLGTLEGEDGRWFVTVAGRRLPIPVREEAP